MRFSPNPNRAAMIRWFDWGEEAFAAAREQNKPVMLFLCAFWCRYCQRMDEEAFSEMENIALLRAYFISIRAENAQRPDVDVRYNQNGWPTIVFMTPAGEAILAANYLTSEQLQDLLLRVYMSHQQGAGSAQMTPLPSDGALEPSDPRARLNEAALVEITGRLMAVADRDHGGYGAGQKFIQSELNDFLLARYEATANPGFLNHVCFTLDRMREQGIHDRKEGGYFRTSTGPDWDQPHREKLLAEQAGLITNCLRAYRLTRRPEYARMAEEIIDYLNTKLNDPSTGAFYGCEDFLRVTGPQQTPADEFFSVIDKYIYTDANALAIMAYLDAAEILEKADFKERALRALDFLRLHCRNPGGGMYHYFDGSARLDGCVGDQVFMGQALVRAFEKTGEMKYLQEAVELGEMISSRFNNPAGGYFDIGGSGFGLLRFRLTLIEQNGPAASFFLALGAATGHPRWRDAALWALSAFNEDLGSYGVHAAAFGQALNEYFEDAK
jgi:uncharacterized protein YyaL (SSP411 family)